MPSYSIIGINSTNILLLQALADEAAGENYLFVQRTIDEWLNGTNTFTKPGEHLWGLCINNNCVAIGGLNQDPYINNATVGRVRHLYVSKAFRGCGLSKVLMQLILSEAKGHFTSLRLSTQNHVAERLYASMGFSKCDGWKVTHVINNLDNISLPGVATTPV